MRTADIRELTDPERLIDGLEASALFGVALRQRTLALVFVDDGPDGLIIPASDGP